jgi:hypothetical protein
MAVADDTTRLMPRGGLTIAAIVGLAASVLAIGGIPLLRDTLSMWDLGQGPSPYFIPSHALRLYILTPLVTLATAILFVAPGLSLAATFGRDKGVAYWLICAFAWSLPAITLPTAALQLATGAVLKGPAFGALVLAVALCCFGLLAFRLSQGRRMLLRIGPDRADLMVGIILFLLMLILLAPKFYWENFTGDGSGSLQFARLYIHTLWPFWMPEAGTIAKAPGLSMVLFVLPESWFVRLWGEAEFSVRAPYLMYLAMVYPVIAGLIRFGGPGLRDRAIHLGDHVLIAGALGVYTVTIIYSGGYNPYFGDSPMPAARETLAIALFLGYVLALAQDRLSMMVLTGLLASITIPTGGLWLGMVAVACWLVWGRSDPRRTRASLLVVLLAVAVSVLVPLLIGVLGLNYPAEGEFGVKAIVNRLRYVALTDWERFAFVIVPCGIVPAAFLLTWRSQDRMARVVTLATTAFFLFFYLQGYRVLLHHFAPVMLAPLVVFWRSPHLHTGVAAGFLRPLAGLGLVASLWLAWPAEMRLHDFDRGIGAAIETSGPVFETAERGPGDRFRGFEPKALAVAHDLLGQMFPIGYRDTDAQERFYGAPLVWWFYSEFPKPDGQAVNYRIKPLADASPADGAKFAEFDGYGLYIADPAVYEAHRTTVLPTDTGARIFVVSRDQMFGKGAKTGDRLVIDLVAVVRGIFGLKPPAADDTAQEG